MSLAMAALADRDTARADVGMTSSPGFIKRRHPAYHFAHETQRMQPPTFRWMIPRATRSAAELNAGADWGSDGRARRR